MDNDEIIITKAAATAAAIDIKYKRATPTDKMILKPLRDEAFSAYAGARLTLLEEGTVSGDTDVEEMKSIRRQVSNAKKQQSLAVAIGRFIVFMGKFA